MNIVCVEEISFGKRLKALLEEQGKTQGELAYHCHINKNSISAWISKDKPIGQLNDRYGNKLERIAKFLHVDVEYLECTQVEKVKKNSESFRDFDFEKIAKEANQIHAFLTFVKGCHIKVNQYSCDPYEYQFVCDSKIYTVKEDGTEELYVFSKEGKEREFNGEELDTLISNCRKIIECLIFDFQIKEKRNDEKD